MTCSKGSGDLERPLAETLLYRWRKRQDTRKAKEKHHTSRCVVAVRPQMVAGCSGFHASHHLNWQFWALHVPWRDASPMGASLNGSKPKRSQQQVIYAMLYLILLCNARSTGLIGCIGEAAVNTGHSRCQALLPPSWAVYCSPGSSSASEELVFCL